MALQTYLKEKGTNQIYKLGEGGYYQKYTGDVGGVAPTDVNSIADYYSQQARGETDPYYQPRIESTRTQGAEDLNAARTRLKALYTDRGTGDSSFARGDLSRTSASMGRDLTSQLTELERQRNEAYKTALGGYTSQQQAGEARDYEYEQERIAAEQAAEDRRIKAEQDERLYQLQLQMAQQDALNRGTSGGSLTAAEQKSVDRQDLGMTISRAVENWYSRAADRFRRGEMRGSESEDVYVPQIRTEASRLGLDPDEAEETFYAMRKPYEKTFGR